jgi:hypothetical protein
MTDDVENLRRAIRRDFPVIAASEDRAWSRPPAVRVIDCVLSLNRQYDNFVVPRLDEFEKRFPSIVALTALRQLIDTYESPAAFVEEALNYNDRPRSAVLSAVLDYLLRFGLRGDGSELEKLQRWAQAARPKSYANVNVKGFGLAGYQYLRMLFGANTTKPDVHIRRYVSAAVGRSVPDEESITLLEAISRSDAISLRDLDTTIWEHSAR